MFKCKPTQKFLAVLNKNSNGWMIRNLKYDFPLKGTKSVMISGGILHSTNNTQNLDFWSCDDFILKLPKY